MAWAGSGAQEMNRGVMAGLSMGVDRTLLGHTGGPPCVHRCPSVPFVHIYTSGVQVHMGAMPQREGNLCARNPAAYLGEVQRLPGVPFPAVVD